MKRLLFVILLINHLHGAELIFKSGFEDGVYLSKVERRDSEIWWQDIRGSDNADFSWPIILDEINGTLQMITNKKNIDDYIVNSFEIIKGKNGKKNRVFHQVIKKKEFEDAQDPYAIYLNKKEQKKLYIRYQIKFPKNLKDILGPDGWLTFCEYKTDSDYRLAFYIYCDKKKNLYWYVHGDNVVLDDRPYKEFWSLEDHKHKIKTGEWLDVEIFWNRSKNKDGRTWLSVDGETIFDYHGKTKIHDSIHEIMLFTNYANVPLEQWIDNVELWSDFPCGDFKSCHKNKN